MGRVFLAAFRPKLNVIFHFSTIYYFNHIKLLSPLTPLWGEINICAPLLGRQTYVPADLFVRNSIPNNFYLKLFFMGCVFLAALSFKLNVIFHFSPIYYFNHIKLSSPLASLWGEIDICARGLFVRNSIPNKLEPFFNGMHTLGDETRIHATLI